MYAKKGVLPIKVQPNYKQNLLFFEPLEVDCNDDTYFIN
jgi:hypothetical protein